MYDFDLLVSTNGTDWTTALSSSSSGSTLELEDHTFPAVRARYVRIVGHGSQSNWWNSVTELRVLPGTEAWPPALEPKTRLAALDFGDETLTVDVQDAAQLAVTAQYSDGTSVALDPPTSP